MAHLKIQPAGQMTLDSGDRKPVVKVVGGDTWSVSVNLYNPIDPREPATPDNTIVEIRLAETQFDNPLWKGEWFTGIVPDETRKGLCRIVVPRAVTAALRRGSYMFSVRVMDILKSAVVTEAEGSFLVEYKTTSDQHSIPYKDGTSQGGQTPITPGADDVEKLEHELEDHVKNTTMHVTSGQKAEWSGKQDAIPDLQEIRDGAAKGVSAYQTLEQGVPRASLASDVQASLGKADTAIQEADLASYVNDADYDSSSKRIQLKHGDTVVAYIDATAFIKDGMVSNVEIVGGDLVITFNTDAGLEPIEIPLTDIFDTDNYYDKTASDARFATKADATLTEKWTPTFALTDAQKAAFSSEPGASDNDYALTIVPYSSAEYLLYVGSYQAAAFIKDPSNSTKLIFEGGDARLGLQRDDLVATLSGYQLGSQTTKPVASEAEAEALRTGKADRAANPTAGNLAALDANGNPTDSGLSKDDVESLFFSQYYPDGSVKSAAEFTPGIKYNAPDTTNRTITVKPLANRDGTAENDNSSLVGRVVIPPFVDANGNGYISDDGTRYKVVGVGSGTDSNNSNENLTAVIAPSTVANIEDKAFHRCTKLTSVSAQAATSIGNGAFNTCSSLASVSLPAAESIVSWAFVNCTSLKSISLSAATSIGDNAFRNCTSLKSVSLPAATSIKGNAFNSCYLLASVSLPAATSIESNAFATCTSLTSVSLPAATRIRNYAFLNCTKLASVSLPAATSIEGYAFALCTSLASVSLPAATSIGNSAFATCTSLTSVDFGATLSSAPTLGSSVFNGVSTSCKIIVPDSQYDAWIAANGWRDLYNNGNGYKFLKHSEWEYARKYEVSQEIQDAIDGIKPTRIYNSAGTDALDDKGGLHKSDIVQSSWTLKKSGTATTYTFSYAGRNAGNDPNLFWWAQDGQNYSWMTYNPTTGVIDYVAGGTRTHTNLGTTEYGLDPSTGDVLPDISGITIKMFPNWATISVDLTFTPTQVQLLSESYTHLAVESVPTRTIAASTVYSVGDLLGDDGKAYRCIQEYTSDATPVAPSLDMTRWVEIPVLSQKADKVSASGMLKGNGSGGVSAAVPGTDYMSPDVPVVKTPVYDGNNHYYANASDSETDIYQFERVGTHRWTMTRKGILYLRLASASSNTATVRIFVNEADDGHRVLAMSMSNNVTAFPLFLNAGDVVLLDIVNSPLSYVQYSAFYTD